MPGRNRADARGDIKFRRWKKYGDETPRDHVVDPALHLIEMFGPGGGRDDGEVIGDLRIVEDALVRAKPAVFKNRSAVLRQIAPQIHQSLTTCRDVVFGKRA